MSSRFIGGLLLIIGTSIGGGMLALPVVNAASGFIGSSVFLIMCWLLMTLGAFLILEVNLYLSPGKHLSSMALATLGRVGLGVTWICYLLLMYVLLCAYIAGGADVLRSILAYFVTLNDTTSTILFAVLFGFIVYSGIGRVDVVNRALMLLKLASLGVLIVVITPFVQPNNLYGVHATCSLMVLVTSFGFAIIVPNLRTYFDDDVQKLKQVIWLGSLIPLICYVLWDAVIMGSVISSGTNSLVAVANNPHTTSALSLLLAVSVHNSWVIILFNFFTSICMLTAFLGVALCLKSFLSDGLCIDANGISGLLLMILTLFPPILLVLYYPGVYLQALNYAGYLCVILLLFLPALMALQGRKKYRAAFTVWGGSYSLWFLMISAVLLCLYSI